MMDDSQAAAVAAAGAPLRSPPLPLSSPAPPAAAASSPGMSVPAAVVATNVTGAFSPPPAATDPHVASRPGYSPQEQALLSKHPLLVSLRAAFRQWHGIGLDRLRHDMDAVALGLEDAERRSQAARRALADATKGWKKLASDAERAAQLGPLIRAYQEEVNQLTRRATTSETAFLAVYKQLLEAPDPAALLSATVTQVEPCLLADQSLLQARAHLSDAQSQLAEYEREFTGLKNQDVTIRRLEAEKRELEANVRQIVAQQVAERARDGAQELAEARQAFEQRERMLMDKLDSYKEQLSAAMSAQSSIASAALSRDRQAAESAELAAQSDANVMEAEIERLTLELSKQARECAELQQQLRVLQEAPGGATADARAERAEAAAAMFASERSRLEEENEAIRARLEASDARLAALQSQSEQLSRSLSDSQSALEESEARSAASLAALRAELAAQPSQAQVEELRRQLREVQEIQFGSCGAGEQEREGEREGESGSRLASPGPSDVRSVSPASLSSGPSQLLLSKARRLESELTSLRLAHASLEGACQAARAEAEEARSSLQHTKELCGRMEEELAKASSAAVQAMAQQAANLANPAVQLSSALVPPPDFTVPHSVRGASQVPPVGLYVDTGATPDATGHLSASPPSFPAPTPASLVSTLQAQLSQSSSMLHIVLAQRDRYRGRLEAVESERVELLSAHEKAKAEAAALRQDNLALYEKLQFVQSGAGAGAGAGAGGRSLLSSAPAASLSRGVTDSESRYAQLYEARLNPFHAFKRRMRADRESSLSAPERLLLALGRLVVNRKVARTALCLYALVLHLLVMMVLWTHSVGDHCATVATAQGAMAGKLAAHKHS